MKKIFLLLRVETRYRRLLTASLISGIGDWFNSVALLSLLLHFTGSGLAVGLTLAVRTLPYLVMGPIGGILTDKFNRKKIRMISDFARAVLALTFLFILIRRARCGLHMRGHLHWLSFQHFSPLLGVLSYHSSFKQTV